MSGFLAWIGTARGLVPVEAISSNAADIRDLYVFVGVFASLIFLVVTVPLVAFVVRFRSGGRPREEEGPQIRGHTNLELFWTAGPVLILVAIATFTFVKLDAIVNAPAAANELTVRVIGRQFYWQFEYPNGVVAVDRMRVPVDTVVNVEITAPDFDVIHSWWVPELGGKRDAIPGRVNTTWYKAGKTGVFDGRCGELCGIQHSLMTTSAEVMEERDFAVWLAAETRAQLQGTSDLGSQVFEGVCAKCHGDQGQGAYAQAIAGSAIFDDPEATENLLENGVDAGTRVMPPVGRDWSDRQMRAVTEYLRQNLGPQAAGGSSGG